CGLMHLFPFPCACAAVTVARTARPIATCRFIMRVVSFSCWGSGFREAVATMCFVISFVQSPFNGFGSHGSTASFERRHFTDWDAKFINGGQAGLCRVRV